MEKLTNSERLHLGARLLRRQAAVMRKAARLAESREKIYGLHSQSKLLEPLRKKIQ